MTLKECYEGFHGSYDDAKNRLMTDKLITRFILKFLDDNSMSLLRDAIKAENLEESFRGAHTLKGVAANLAFSELQEAASELTEFYRNSDCFSSTPLYDALEASYQLTVETIQLYKAGLE